MSIRALKPFIPSGPDFEVAKAFFRDLGFAVNWEAEGLAELQLGGATFLLRDFHNQEMQSNLMMFVSVEDLGGKVGLVNIGDTDTHVLVIELKPPPGTGAPLSR